MRAKLTLAKNFGMKKPWRKSKQWHKKYKKCQFCTQRRPRNSSSHKFSKKYNEQ